MLREKRRHTGSPRGSGGIVGLLAGLALGGGLGVLLGYDVRSPTR